MRLALSHLILLIATLSAACTPPPRLLPRHAPPPSHLLQGTDTGTPQLILSPGAAYLIGLRDTDAYPLGQWLAATPGPLWPNTTERPTLAVGRVVERQPRWARVELAGIVDSQRSPSLDIFPTDTPRSLTKRVLSVDLSVHGEATVPAGSAHLITGRELYGVLPPNPPLDQRLSASFRGVVRLLPQTAQQSRVIPWVGEGPQRGDRLVLIGASSPPELPVHIELATFPKGHPLHGRSVELRAELEQRLRTLGINAVSVERSTDTLDTVTAREDRLGGDVSSRLTFLVHPGAYGDDRLSLSTQLDRVALHPVFTSGVPLTVPRHALPRVVAAHVLIARGEFGAAAHLLEALLPDTHAIDVYLAPHHWLGALPLLATCYLRMGRPDWELELHAHMLAIRPLLSSPATQLLDDALASTAAQLGSREDTAPPLSEDDRAGRAARATRVLRGSRPEAARAEIEALLDENAGTVPGWLTALQLELGLATTDTHHTPAAIARIEASSPAVALRLEALRLNAMDDTPSELVLDLASQADALGAPALSMSFFLTAARQSSRPQKATALLIRAAALLDAARRPADLIDLISRLELEQPQQLASLLPEHVEVRYVDALATLDARATLGLRGLYQASLEPDPERAREILTLTHELFLSIGDHLNVGFTLLALAELDHAQGLDEAAHVWLERARAFEALAGYEALTVARAHLEHKMESAPILPGG